MASTLNSNNVSLYTLLLTTIGCYQNSKFSVKYQFLMERNENYHEDYSRNVLERSHAYESIAIARVFLTVFNSRYSEELPIPDSL